MDKSNLIYTLCFIERGDNVLMLHRKRAPNQGMWNGIGGRIEPGETPRQCVLREIQEETGLNVKDVTFEGILTWEGFEIPAGGLYLFTAQSQDGELHANDEGELAWKPREWVLNAPDVVSNIHAFGPWVLRGNDPREHHFNYLDGNILSYERFELPEEIMVEG